MSTESAIGYLVFIHQVLLYCPTHAHIIRSSMGVSSRICSEAGRMDFSANKSNRPASEQITTYIIIFLMFSIRICVCICKCICIFWFLCGNLYFAQRVYKYWWKQFYHIMFRWSTVFTYGGRWWLDGSLGFSFSLCLGWGERDGLVCGLISGLIFSYFNSMTDVVLKVMVLSKQICIPSLVSIPMHKFNQFMSIRKFWKLVKIQFMDFC